MTRKSNYALAVTMGLLVFIVVYPPLEFHTKCPDAREYPDKNESCIEFKGLLWELTVLLSLGIQGDGIQFSDSLDEKHYRSIVPLLITMIIILFYQKQEITKQ
jgi:hypothetical protein